MHDRLSEQPDVLAHLTSQIPEIDFVPLSLDVWVPPRAKDRELVVVGDGGGWVRLFEASLPGEDGRRADHMMPKSALRLPYAPSNLPHSFTSA